MNTHNPFADPLFVPSLQIVGALFGGGLGIVLFFARENLRAGLTGELGKRLIGWILIASLFLAAVFISGIVGAVILLFFFFRISAEYIRVVGVERPYALFVYALIPITFLVALFAPEFHFALPAGSILLLTLVPILSGRVENVYRQLSFAGRGYLYLVWTTGYLILLQQLAGDGMLVLTAVSVALSDASSAGHESDGPRHRDDAMDESDGTRDLRTRDCVSIRSTQQTTLICNRVTHLTQ